MAFPLTSEQIFEACGKVCPLANIQANWPLVEQAFASRNLASNLVAIAAIATIRVECPPFKPIHEYGNPERFASMYDIEGQRPQLARTLGNLTPGDGVKYAGRGFIQLTGKANYQHMSDLLSIDIVGDPDKALDPQTAADIFALFFRDHGCIDSANARNWQAVRREVNGGLNGLDLFQQTVNNLLALLPTG